MLKYTICFIQRKDKILMLNRHSFPQMGVWNGVGGKLDAGETPEECVKREVLEETGILLDKVTSKGIVTWDKGSGSGMYAFLAVVTDDFQFQTPKNMAEGILDWKTLDWLTHPENRGVAAHVKQFLPKMIHDPHHYEFQCFFNDDGSLGECRAVLLEEVTK
jgi:8-oxo-dGTP diphosphatase